MSMREHYSNRELTTDELDSVTGGGLKEVVQSAVAAALKAKPDGGGGGYVGGKTGIQELANYQL